MRKKLMGILVCLLLIGSAFFMVRGVDRLNIEGFIGINEKNKKIESKIKDLSEIINSKYETSSEDLKKATYELGEKKTEFENQAILSNTSDLSYVSSKQTYDIDFLWTEIGNFARDENVVIKIDVTEDTLGKQILDKENEQTENTESTAENTEESNNEENNNDNVEQIPAEETPSNAAGGSSAKDYVLCDLKFTVTGSYVDITEFIYDIENDSKLGFKIDNFTMTGSDTLSATFTCNGIKIKTIQMNNVTTSTNTENNLKEENKTENETSNESETEEEANS